MARLNEGDFVYTDRGIEQVHWCEVNGKKQLVSPKGFIFGDVPPHSEYMGLLSDNIEFMLKNHELEKQNLLLTIANAELNDRLTIKKGLDK